MKLKNDFVTYEMGNEQIMVAVGKSDFHGLARSNSTAALIVDLLKTETDRESIIRAMLEKYDAPEERISADTDRVLETLRSIGALDE